jgi:hypothetical protein
MERWRREGSLTVTNELGSWDLGWGFVEDFERYREDRLRALYRTPSLLFQGCEDDRVPWRSVLDFALGCELTGVDLHLFPDGDHRLTDLQPRLWELMRRRLVSGGWIPEVS